MLAPASSLVRCSFVALGAALLPASAAAQCGIQKLTASDAASERFFGYTGLAIDRDRLAVGSAVPVSPVVYVFEHDGVAWTEVAKLERAWPGGYDAFGTSIAIDGERIVVGGPGKPNAAIPGFVYVFEKSASGWAETARLEPPQGQAKDRFGISVSIDGDLIAVGASGDDRFGTNAGAAFVYRLGGGGWSLEGILAPPVSDPVRFGTSIAASGDEVLVGAPYDVKGSVHFFRPAAGEWRLEQSVTFGHPHGHPGDEFGATVALEGDRAVVGAPMHGCWNNCLPAHLDDEAGSVMVLERDDQKWKRTRELVGGGYLWKRGLGRTLGMSTGLVVAGGSDRNVVSSMRLEDGSSDAGYQLRAGAVEEWFSGERFGSAIAVGERWFAIGAGADDEAAPLAGAVYVHRRLPEFTPFCCKDIGSPFCTPPEEHNGAWGAWLQVDGSEDTALDCLYLHAGRMPHEAVGTFLLGKREDRVQLPGHAGPFCLAGAGLVRLNRAPIQVYSDEVISLTVGTRSIPGLATGIVPGSAWAFQAWYRSDQVMGFTDAVEVTFR